MKAGKGAGPLRHGPIPKLTGLPGAYHCPGLVQNGIIWAGWEREARRLFILFWQTANERHLRAFAAHVRAMRLYGGPR
jgi:hypothetical protein